MNKGTTVSKDQGFGKIDFMKLAPAFGVVSLVLIVASLLLIATKGFVYGIDFAGGTEMQVKFEQPVDSGKIRSFVESVGLKNAEIQSFPESNEFVLRFDSGLVGKSDKETTDALNQLVEKTSGELKSTFSAELPEIRRVDTVGPQVGSELKRSGLLAVFYSILVILIYIGLRFDYKYAPSAVVCLIHDVIITMGIFSLVDHQVNVQTLVSIMTIIGYSLNDTIINFDRLRENSAIYRDRPVLWLINRSANDVLSRSILTSFTTLLSVGALYFLAGGVIEDLAFTLGIGIVIGTYSSIYIASPMVYLMDKFAPAKVARA